MKDSLEYDAGFINGYFSKQQFDSYRSQYKIDCYINK